MLKFAGLRIKELFRIKRNETLIYLYCRFVHFILVVSKCESWVPFRDSGVGNRSCTAVDTNRHDDDSAGILFHYLCKWDLLSESPFYDIFNNTFWAGINYWSSVKVLWEVCVLLDIRWKQRKHSFISPTSSFSTISCITLLLLYNP